MATKTQVQQGTPIDKVLSETDIGAWIAEHKTLFIGIVTGIVLSVLGWGVGRHYIQKGNEEHRQSIYQFKLETMKQFQEKKIEPQVVVTKFKDVQTKTKNFRGLAPIALSLADELVIQGKPELGLTVLEDIYPVLSKENSYLNHLLSFRMAAILEDSGKADRAIEILEKLNTSSLKLMEWKVYLDLGRLYLQKGNQEKAKNNLQYLIDNSSDEEFIKLAKLYMAKI